MMTACRPAQSRGRASREPDKGRGRDARRVARSVDVEGAHGICALASALACVMLLVKKLLLLS